MSWRCFFGFHSCVTCDDDETHIWGECIRCGKRFGIISRAAIRRYIEAKERYRAALASLNQEPK